MTKIIYGLFGVGGFSREVMPRLKRVIDASAELVFVDREAEQTEINGYAVLNEDEFFRWPGEKRFNTAIGDSQIRMKIAERCAQNGVTPFDFRDETAILGDDVRIGEGACLCSNAIITSNVEIGRHFQLNLGAYVAHDCVIGNYVTFAPGVQCNGNVHIDDHAYVGTGAILRHGSHEKPLKIGARAVIGMGAVVTKDVPPNVTVVGNPARPLEM